MDYGQFTLYGSTDPNDDADLDDDADFDDDAELVLLHAALDGDGVAGDGSMLVVLSPHQYNFAMALTIDVWEQAPPDDLTAWELAVEGHLTIAGDPPTGHGELIYGSPTLETEDWRVPAGEHHVRVCGTGFVAVGDPGSTKPGDRWRVQLWRCDCGTRPRRLRQWPLRSD